MTDEEKAQLFEYLKLGLARQVAAATIDKMEIHKEETITGRPIIRYRLRTGAQYYDMYPEPHEVGEDDGPATH